jgi:hypothetical protein
MDNIVCVSKPFMKGSLDFNNPECLDNENDPCAKLVGLSSEESEESGDSDVKMVDGWGAIPKSLKTQSPPGLSTSKHIKKGKSFL